MKITITFIFILCSLSAFSQTVAYALDTTGVKGNEFFINEIIRAAPTETAPRPLVTINPIRFTDTVQVQQYIFSLRSDAKKASDEANRIITIANNLLVKAAEMEAFVKNSEFLSGKKPAEVAKK